MFCFMSEGHDNSQVLVNIANTCDEWAWVKGAPHLEVANLVNSHNPHILIELNGYTDGARIEVNSSHSAPPIVWSFPLGPLQSADCNFFEFGA
jgi:hypothetical protein